MEKPTDINVVKKKKLVHTKIARKKNTILEFKCRTLKELLKSTSNFIFKLAV